MPLPRIILPSVLVSLTLALAACGDGDDNAKSTSTGDAGATPTTPPPSGNATAPSGNAVRSAKVEIVDFAYNPDPTTIQAGGKVTWINRDSAPHTATADDGSFDTGTLEQGKLKSENFKQPGSYTYFCQIHPSMHGAIEVVESS